MRKLVWILNGAVIFLLTSILNTEYTFAQSISPSTNQTASLKISSQSIIRYKGNEFDGVWSGSGSVTAGNNCYSKPSMKFMVKEGRIYVDGLSHGVYFGSGSSKVFGVIHVDKSVDLTLINRNGNGRSNQAYGSIDAQSDMTITDIGANCSFSFRLTKG